jgi:hypothetical protein
MGPGELEVLKILRKSNEPVSYSSLNSKGLVGDTLSLINEDLIEIIKKPLYKSDNGVRGEYYPKAFYYRLNENGKKLVRELEKRGDFLTDIV